MNSMRLYRSDIMNCFLTCGQIYEVLWNVSVSIDFLNWMNYISGLFVLGCSQVVSMRVIVVLLSMNNILAHNLILSD